MRSRPALTALAVVLTACYRPSPSITSSPDGEVDPQIDAAVESSPDLPGEPGDDPAPDAEQDPETEPGHDAAGDVPADAWEESDPGGVPVALAPDFELEDLNPNSPTYGSMRRLSDQRGKVIVFYVGNYG
jgi:hypothetical protein